jgi:hypothetical protein
MGHVYHGSPLKCFEIVEPRRNIRSKESAGRNEIIFDDLSFHATPHRWIALTYTYRAIDGYSMGVSLYENTQEVAIIGPDSLEKSLVALYGEGGYLYIFDGSSFFHTSGLGSLEVITQDKIKPVEVHWIPDPVKALKDEGVSFTFIKRDPRKPNAQ